MDNSPSFETRNVNADDVSNSITIQIHELREEIQSMYDLESSCSDLYATADRCLIMSVKNYLHFLRRIALMVLTACTTSLS